MAELITIAFCLALISLPLTLYGAYCLWPGIKRWVQSRRVPKVPPRRTQAVRMSQSDVRRLPDLSLPDVDAKPLIESRQAEERSREIRERGLQGMRRRNGHGQGGGC